MKDILKSEKTKILVYLCYCLIVSITIVLPYNPYFSATDCYEDQIYGKYFINYMNVLYILLYLEYIILHRKFDKYFLLLVGSL